MEILTRALSPEELKSLLGEFYPDMIKAVVDVDSGRMAINAELHSDLESLLLEEGSKLSSLWGINIYPDLIDEALIEYDSLINIRPHQDNRSRMVENPTIRQAIEQIVRRYIC